MYQKVTITLPKTTVKKLHTLAPKGERSTVIAELIDKAEQEQRQKDPLFQLGLPQEPTPEQIQSKLTEVKQSAGLYENGPSSEEIIDTIYKGRNRHDWVRN